MPPRMVRLCVLLATLAGFIIGCGAGTGGSSASPISLAPAISTQPQNQSVPMGLSAIYAVVATGANLQYQWLKNGSSISGATTASYMTPATAFSDSGASFTVSISNQAGSITSIPASLTITARAPKTGDLRFGQVDAASTVNGYHPDGVDIPLFCLGPGQGGMIITAPGDTGTPYFLGNTPCPMEYQTFAPAATVTGIEVVYAVWPLSGYPAVLSDPALWTHLPPPSSGASVLQSLTFTSITAGFSFIYDSNSSGFAGTSYTTPLASLQSAATQEAQRGRVITALTSDGSQATYFSYGWSGDASTIYESKVVTATLNTAVAAVTSLASEGYILTASGGTQASDGSGVILIGTRVQGDTMPRPVNVGVVTSTSNTSAITMQSGYAIVAVVQTYDVSGAITYNLIGER